jgi:hypothetical protein
LLRDFGQPFDVAIPPSRKGQRFIIATKVWFNWQTKDGRWLEGDGITRDISGDGLFVLTDTLPTVGAPIIVVVEMPALKMLPRPVTFRGSGKIVRIEPEVGGLCGFAAAVTFDDNNSYCSNDFLFRAIVRNVDISGTKSTRQWRC